MKCNNCCNICHQPDCCGGCKPACPEEHFSIEVDPYDSQNWFINGAKVRVPKMAETCTSLSTDFSGATLNYIGECGKDIITGRQLGQIIKLDDLRDVEAEHPDNCSILAWNPHCDYCAEGCTKVGSAWEPYVIPDAGDCVMDTDDEGYYHVLKKTDCGCIVECKMPVMPSGMTSLNYVRDSVPDDPDFPWYYGCYNDTINLYLAQNAPEYFGKYALKVTVNYGIQVIKSDKCPNVNFRSIVCPVVGSETPQVARVSSILQDNSTYSASAPEIPWASVSMRGSFVFIVPKGQEASLHHEFRLHTISSFPQQDHYYKGPWDGQRVPDAEAVLNGPLHPASRLNALQVIIEPTQGEPNYDPSRDPERNQLDPPEDEYLNL